MVIQIQDSLLDPSYEIHSKKVNYVDKLHLAFPKGLQAEECGLSKKETIAGFLNFVSLANRMNEGELIITNKEYYHSMADYVQRRVCQ